MTFKSALVCAEVAACLQASKTEQTVRIPFVRPRTSKVLRDMYRHIDGVVRRSANIFDLSRANTNYLETFSA